MLLDYLNTCRLSQLSHFGLPTSTSTSSSFSKTTSHSTSKFGLTKAHQSLNLSSTPFTHMINQ